MSEKRMIDANALLARLKDLDDWCGDLRKPGIEQARCMVHEAPTIDAVEVVRCACCISFMEYAAEHKQAAEGADGDCFIRINFSDYPDYYAVKKDDYCADGKRKEAADE